MTALYGASSHLIFEDASKLGPLLSTAWRRMRARQLITLLAAVTLVFMTFSLFRRPHYPRNHITVEFTFPPEQPIELLGPLQPTDTSLHPIDQLIKKSEDEFNRLLARQSQTLDAAVAEYKRRYRIPPPPNFDIWFAYAKRKNVQLIDEYDTIYHSLLPFWALEPSVIRSRVDESIGFEGNFLMAVTIREGQIAAMEAGEEWEQKAITGMMADFIRYLPDMNLAFNIHDEPRVILPHDILSRLVDVALSQSMPAAFATREPRNNFSPRPSDLNDGKRIREALTTRFNRFAHQHTWTHSRMSCSPDSPARSFNEQTNDNITPYALSDLGFVYNHSAFNDICLSPSLKDNFGFFDRPNAFNLVQDLFPVFSQSKISSYQDILYPSPWYWAGKVDYVEKRDMEWQKKEPKLYWRGSTTGGFSRDGGWRRQHRQRIVRKINEPDNAKIMANKGSPESPNWQPLDVRRKDYEEIVDVKFSHVGQCDPGDCDAQKEYFHVVDRVDQQDAWGYKYLLDMDGNAFSGRFYAFLKSNSLIFKMNMFQEWHKDWVKPWLHYIPLSLRGDDWLETVRYFAGEEEGKRDAPRLAAISQDWANKALRNEDLEVWFFRLLLEYVLWFCSSLTSFANQPTDMVG